MKRFHIVLLAVAVATIAVAAAYYIRHDEDYSISESNSIVQEEMSQTESASDPKGAPSGHGTRSDSFPADERQPMPDGWK